MNANAHNRWNFYTVELFEALRNRPPLEPGGCNKLHSLLLTHFLGLSLSHHIDLESVESFDANVDVF